VLSKVLFIAGLNLQTLSCLKILRLWP